MPLIVHAPPAPLTARPAAPHLQEVVSGLRGQVAVARSLKEEAAPEWQDKITKLQELKDIRKTYQEEIAAIKTAQSGLDVKSEV